MATPLVPRAVVQALPNTPAVFAAWLPDGHTLLTATAGSPAVTIWNTDSGYILDTLTLPPVRNFRPQILLRLGLDADATHATLTIFGRSQTENGIEWRVQLYALDLQQRTLRSSGLPQPPKLGQSKTKDAISVLGANIRRLSLPTAPDGRQLRRMEFSNGLEILDRNGTLIRTLGGEERGWFPDADLSPDGHTFAELQPYYGGGTTLVQVWDLANNSPLPTLIRPNHYDHVRWLDNARYMVWQSVGEFDGIQVPTLLPLLIVKADSNGGPRGVVAQRVPGRCLVMPLGASGEFIGAGPRSCKLPMPQVEADGLYRYKSGNWVLQPLAETSAHVITAMATADIGQRLAIVLRPTEPTGHGARLLIFWNGPDGTSATFDLPPLPAAAMRAYADIDAPLEFRAGDIADLAFSQDGASLWFRYGDDDYSYTPAAGLHRIDQAGTLGRRTRAIGGRAVLVTDDGASGIKAALRTGPALLTAAVPIDAVQRIGQIAGRPLVWTYTADGTLNWWDARSGALVLSHYSFPGNEHFAIAPDGRYASNLGADTGAMRWVLPNAPTQALPIETFMSQLFEPDLVKNLLACHADGCADSLLPPPDLGSVNRALPRARIIDATPDKRDADYLIVRVGLTQGRDSDGNLSGLHDLRLFQGGQIVARYPDRDLTGDETLPQWRQATAIANPEAAGETIISLRVLQLANVKSARFSAYAFNSDRVKGESANRSFDLASSPSRWRRAVVLTIGINTTANPAWALSYAASDAAAMSKALLAALAPPKSPLPPTACATPGCSAGGETREYQFVDPILLTSTGQQPIATGAVIRDVFKALAGALPDSKVRALARRIGVAPDALDMLAPEDALIITYSGHGDTVAGQFRLLPGDAAADAAGRPRLETLLSVTELTSLLGRIAARDMVLIIDACHSAASVDDGQFRPGPLGKAGLGQLAFDKGIRILAASQADAVALEFGSIGHGLLSYSLFHDGLNGLAADRSGDEELHVDEWLAWSAARVPELATELAAPAKAPPPSGGSGLIDEGMPPPRHSTVQRPVLFDFHDHFDHGLRLWPALTLSQ
ncbi:MAG: hypothetical protein CFE37_12190 [Alphaproteobacteria bacterium PA4]|nr:MAG: hypothetical protein CFE37_12190 [Alphaproteobacteria bacterium PA4]